VKQPARYFAAAHLGCHTRLRPQAAGRTLTGTSSAASILDVSLTLHRCPQLSSVSSTPNGWQTCRIDRDGDVGAAAPHSAHFRLLQDHLKRGYT
jgi:hypothetical protein